MKDETQPGLTTKGRNGMGNYFIKEIYEKNRAMMTMEGALNLYHLLSRIIYQDVAGDVVEVGCYRGLTAIILQKTLDEYCSEKRLHVYDSFEGLPEKSELDSFPPSGTIKGCIYQDNRRMGKGWFQTSEESLRENFEAFATALPSIHNGWFKDTLPESLPDCISFAHLDGDLYESTLVSLENVYPLMSPGAIAVIDDYCDVAIHKKPNALPGVKKACDAFFADKAEAIEVLAAGVQYQAYFIKK